MLEDRARYQKIFTDLCSYYGTGLYSDRLILHSLILELIYLLLSSTEKQHHRDRIKSGNDKMIEKVIKYIKSHLTSDLSLNTLAEYASFSPIHFHNCFKASTGKTLREYVEEQRLQRAINLLTATDLTLSEIAYECGFSSQSYFSYAFKKKMKITPREYANEIYRRYEK